MGNLKRNFLLTVKKGWKERACRSWSRRKEGKEGEKRRSEGGRERRSEFKMGLEMLCG